MAIPKLFLFTQTGTIPFLSKETIQEADLDFENVGVSLRLADFIAYLDLLEKFQNSTHLTNQNFNSSLLNFVNPENLWLDSKNLKSNKFLLSLKPKQIDQPNSSSKNNISVWSIKGKQELKLSKYYQILKDWQVLDNSKFLYDIYNDSDTISASKKRLQKSAERSVAYHNESIKFLADSQLNNAIFIVNGGSDYRRRLQNLTGILKNSATQSPQILKIENLEPDSAEKIVSEILSEYEKITQNLSSLQNLLISFAQVADTEQNLKILESMADIYKKYNSQSLQICFETSVFFDLADEFIGFEFLDSMVTAEVKSAAVKTDAESATTEKSQISEKSRKRTLDSETESPPLKKLRFWS